jgi:hypothetical protein
MNSTFYARQNDDGKIFRTQLVDEDENPKLLIGAQVRFHMRQCRSEGELAKVDRLATVYDASEGIVEFIFLAGDLDEYGDFDADWEVTYDDGSIETFPNKGYDKVIVSEELKG